MTRALLELAMDALGEAEAHDCAAAVCEDIEALPDTGHESGEDGA